MQDVVIESCGTGIIIVGGESGPFSTGQGVGSFALSTPSREYGDWNHYYPVQREVDCTTFYNTQDAILDNNVDKALVPSGDRTILDSAFRDGKWPKRCKICLCRRRPKYNDIGNSQVLDVKALGAKGDGITDDTTVLNSILARGADMSSIVFFPYGVYVMKDTLKIPPNSRILGQAWSQIMAIGSKFDDARNPRVAVKVGNNGDIGIVETQDLLFTVSGPGAGAVLVEWNIHEFSQGSARL
ncbi:hypothetical protein BDW72DRAFT_198455 [Aspergillus terricola var. indicus]